VRTRRAEPRLPSLCVIERNREFNGKLWSGCEDHLSNPHSALERYRFRTKIDQEYFEFSPII